MLRLSKALTVVVALAILFATASPAVAQKVTTAPEIKGEVSKVDLKKREFTVDNHDLKSEAKKPINFQLGEDATTYVNGAKATFEDMKMGDKVKVEHYRQEGANWYAIIIHVDRKIDKEVVLAEEIKGEVTKVEPEKFEFTATTDLKQTPVNFRLEEDASIYINGTESSLNDLRSGDRINVEHYTQEGETIHAIIIRVDRK